MNLSSKETPTLLKPALFFPALKEKFQYCSNCMFNCLHGCYGQRKHSPTQLDLCSITQELDDYARAKNQQIVNCISISRITLVLVTQFGVTETDSVIIWEQANKQVRRFVYFIHVCLQWCEARLKIPGMKEVHMCWNQSY